MTMYFVYCILSLLISNTILCCIYLDLLFMNVVVQLRSIVEDVYYNGSCFIHTHMYIHIIYSDKETVGYT